MKNIFTIYTLHFLLVLSAVAQQGQNVSLSEFNWLQGTWERQNVKEGSSAFESWIYENDMKFTGKGISMKGSDTTFVENLSIVVKDNELYYVAEVSHNAKPTYFKITEITETGFVCENPVHDFPKKIEYKSEPGSKLIATISGGGKVIPFTFVKID